MSGTESGAGTRSNYTRSTTVPSLSPALFALRERLGKYTFIGATGIVAASLLLILLRATATTWDLSTTIYCTLFSTHLTIAIVFAKRLTLALRSIIFVTVATTTTINGMWHNGVLSVALFAPVIIAVYLTFIYGRRVGLWTLPFQLLITAVIAAAWVSGYPDPGGVSGKLNFQITHWSVAAAAEIGFSITFIFSADFMIRRLNAALVQSERQRQIALDREANFRDLLEFSPIPIMISDRDGAITFLNRHFQKQFGYSVRELPHISRWFDRAYASTASDEALLEIWRSKIEKAAAEDITDMTSEEVAIRCANGARREVVVSGRLQGHNVITLFSDVTDVNRVRRELERARQELLAAIEQSPAAILIADAPEVRVRVANPAALDIFGVSDHKLQNLTLEEQFKIFEPRYPDGTPYGHEDLPLSRAVFKGETLANVEILVHNPEKGDRRVLANGGPIRDGNGEVVAGVVMFVDVTEQRRTEEMLRHSQKMDAIGQLAGGIAHDFNNQIGGVMGYAELLKNDMNNQQHKRWADRILVSATRAADLTRQLLAFSRRGNMRRTTVDLHQIISEVIGMLDHTIDRRITIAQDLHSSPCFTTGDPSQIQNAILNLAINGRDAMPNGGTLTFRTRRGPLDDDSLTAPPFQLSPGVYVRLSISDTGDGIPQSVRDRIFEPFFTTKEKGKGTGMGLAAVYGTMKTHHGAVVVKSKEGKGTTFALHFPADATDAEPTGRDSHIPHSGRGERILILDDEAIVAEMIRDHLVAAGFEVVMFSDAKEAIAYYEAHFREVSLVILDIVMPKMNGIEVFNAIREIYPRSRVLFSSGFSINNDAQSLISRGAAGLLQKPYRKKALLKAVSKAIG